MPARTVTITGLGDFRQLQAELERTGVISAQSNKSIADSAAKAGEAAAAQAKEMGASADEQEAAAARAASAYVDSAEKMTQSQKAAASAAAAVAEASGASADEIVAASARAVEAQKALQSASLETAVTADVSGGRIGTAFDEGTTKAGSALTKLGETGASWGIPLSGSLTKMGKEFDEADSKAAKFSSGLASAGKLALTAGVVGFGVAAVEGVKGASSLQASMTRLETQAGASSGQVKTLTKSILGMAGEVGAKPQELSEGMYHVVSALNATTAPAQRVSTELGVMKAAAEGAQVGGADIVDVTNALDAAVISGLPGLGSYTHAMGSLNTIVGAGDMTMQNLADALGTGLLAPMKNFGVSLQDIGGALAVFGDNNLRGAAAATKLTSAIRIMAAPSKTAAGYLAEVGIKATELGDDIRSHGLVSALEDLKKHLEDSGDTATQQMRVLSNAFGGRQAMGVQILLAQLDRLKDKVKDVSQGGSNFGSDWQKRTENLTAQMDKLRASVEADADRLGFFLIPKLDATGKALGNVIVWFEKNKVAADALGIVIGGALGAAVTAFAYQKAVAFYGGVVKMGEGMIKLASTVEQGAASIIAKLTAQGAAAEGAAATTATADASMEADTSGLAAAMGADMAEMDGYYASLGASAGTAATEVEAADAAMASANEAVGASFTAMLAPIAAVGAALVAAYASVKLVEKGLKALTGEASNVDELLGGNQPGEKGKEGMAGQGPFNLSKNAGAALGPSNSVEQQIVHFFESKGFTPIAASGIAGNSALESSFDPNAPGGGLFQDIGGRGAGQGASTQAQLETAYNELRTSYHGVFEQIQHAKSPQEAANYFEKGFEGPAGSRPGEAGYGTPEEGTAHLAQREAAALAAYERAGGGKTRRAESGSVGGPASEPTLTSGKGTKEPLTAAQEKAAEQLEKGAEKAKEKLETAAEKAKERQEEAAKKAGEELKRHLETVTKGGEALLKKYEMNLQTSTPAAIEKSLGISTTGKYKSIPGLAEAGKTGPLEKELGKSAGSSEAGKQESKLVGELKATHQKALEEMASKLVAAHKEALATLAEEMVSTEQTKLGEQMKVQATEEKDRTTLAEHFAADQLNIVKAEQAQQTDAMKAAGSAITDATQSMSDSFSELAQKIEDQSKVMADSSNAVVEGIKDQTNIEVSILGERGLYGLNLIAQKEEVQLDEMKASYDQQIAQAQREDAELSLSVQQVTAQDEQIVDQDKAMADAQEASAQAHLDAVTVVGDQRIAAAQAEVDSAQLHADGLIGNAELKVLTATGGGKKKEDAAAAALKAAEGEGASLVAGKEAALKGSVEPAVNQAIAAAANELTRTTESWSAAIKQAEQNLAKAKGEGQEQLAKAQQNLQGIEDKAAESEAKKEKEVAVTKEKSQTQYAGSGLTLIQYGLDYNNAQATANEISFALTHQLPV